MSSPGARAAGSKRSAPGPPEKQEDDHPPHHSSSSEADDLYDEKAGIVLNPHESVKPSSAFPSVRQYLQPGLQLVGTTSQADAHRSGTERAASRSPAGGRAEPPTISPSEARASPPAPGVDTGFPADHGQPQQDPDPDGRDHSRCHNSQLYNDLPDYVDLRVVRLLDVKDGLNAEVDLSQQELAVRVFYRSDRTPAAVSAPKLLGIVDLGVRIRSSAGGCYFPPFVVIQVTCPEYWEQAQQPELGSCLLSATVLLDSARRNFCGVFPLVEAVAGTQCGGVLLQWQHGWYGSEDLRLAPLSTATVVPTSQSSKEAALRSFPVEKLRELLAERLKSRILLGGGTASCNHVQQLHVELRHVFHAARSEDEVLDPRYHYGPALSSWRRTVRWLDTVLPSTIAERKHKYTGSRLREMRPYCFVSCGGAVSGQNFSTPQARTTMSPDLLDSEAFAFLGPADGSEDEKDEQASFYASEWILSDMWNNSTPNVYDLVSDIWSLVSMSNDPLVKADDTQEDEKEQAAAAAAEAAQEEEDAEEDEDEVLEAGGNEQDQDAVTPAGGAPQRRNTTTVAQQQRTSKRRRVAVFDKLKAHPDALMKSAFYSRLLYRKWFTNDGMHLSYRHCRSLFYVDMSGGVAGHAGGRGVDGVAGAGHQTIKISLFDNPIIGEPMEVAYGCLEVDDFLVDAFLGALEKTEVAQLQASKTGSKMQEGARSDSKDAEHDLRGEVRPKPNAPSPPSGRDNEEKAFVPGGEGGRDRVLTRNSTASKMSKDEAAQLEQEKSRLVQILGAADPHLLDDVFHQFPLALSHLQVPLRCPRLGIKVGHAVLTVKLLRKPLVPLPEQRTAHRFGGRGGRVQGQEAFPSAAGGLIVDEAVAAPGVAEAATRLLLEQIRETRLDKSSRMARKLLGEEGAEWQDWDSLSAEAHTMHACCAEHAAEIKKRMKRRQVWSSRTSWACSNGVANCCGCSSSTTSTPSRTSSSRGALLPPPTLYPRVFAENAICLTCVEESKACLICGKRKLPGGTGEIDEALPGGEEFIAQLRQKRRKIEGRALAHADAAGSPTSIAEDHGHAYRNAPEQNGVGGDGSLFPHRQLLDGAKKPRPLVSLALPELMRGTVARLFVSVLAEDCAGDSVFHEDIAHESRVDLRNAIEALREVLRIDDGDAGAGDARDSLLGGGSGGEHEGNQERDAQLPLPFTAAEAARDYRSAAGAFAEYLESATAKRLEMKAQAAEVEEPADDEHNTALPPGRGLAARILLAPIFVLCTALKRDVSQARLRSVASKVVRELALPPAVFHLLEHSGLLVYSPLESAVVANLPIKSRFLPSEMRPFRVLPINKLCERAVPVQVQALAPPAPDGAATPALLSSFLEVNYAELADANRFKQQNETLLSRIASLIGLRSGPALKPEALLRGTGHKFESTIAFYGISVGMGLFAGTAIATSVVATAKLSKAFIVSVACHGHPWLYGHENQYVRWFLGTPLKLLLHSGVCPAAKFLKVLPLLRVIGSGELYVMLFFVFGLMNFVQARTNLILRLAEARETALDEFEGFAWKAWRDSGIQAGAGRLRRDVVPSTRQAGEPGAGGDAEGREGPREDPAARGSRAAGHDLHADVASRSDAASPSSVPANDPKSDQTPSSTATKFPTTSIAARTTPVARDAADNFHTFVCVPGSFSNNRSEIYCNFLHALPSHQTRVAVLRYQTNALYGLHAYLEAKAEDVARLYDTYFYYQLTVALLNPPSMAVFLTNWLQDRLANQNNAARFRARQVGRQLGRWIFYRCCVLKKAPVSLVAYSYGCSVVMFALHELQALMRAEGIGEDEIEEGDEAGMDEEEAALREDVKHRDQGTKPRERGSKRIPAPSTSEQDRGRGSDNDQGTQNSAKQSEVDNKENSNYGLLIQHDSTADAAANVLASSGGAKDAPPRHQPPIQNLVFMGAHVRLGTIIDSRMRISSTFARKKWYALKRKLIAGRFVNAYASNDNVLTSRAIGVRLYLGKVGLYGVPGVENVNVTSRLHNHASYHNYLCKELLEELDLS